MVTRNFIANSFLCLGLILGLAFCSEKEKPKEEASKQQGSASQLEAQPSGGLFDTRLSDGGGEWTLLKPDKSNPLSLHFYRYREAQKVTLTGESGIDGLETCERARPYQVEGNTLIFLKKDPCVEIRWEILRLTESELTLEWLNQVLPFTKVKPPGDKNDAGEKKLPSNTEESITETIRENETEIEFLKEINTNAEVKKAGSVVGHSVTIQQYGSVMDPEPLLPFCKIVSATNGARPLEARTYGVVRVRGPHDGKVTIDDGVELAIVFIHIQLKDNWSIRCQTPKTQQGSTFTRQDFDDVFGKLVRLRNPPSKPKK